MKKHILLSTALLSTAIAMGTTPLFSHAADATTTANQKKKCYTVYAGQGLESLTETLKQLGITFGNNGTLCPDTSKPTVNKPCIPTPDTDTPDINTPDIDTPDNDTTDNGSTGNGSTGNGSVDNDSTDNSTLTYAEQILKLVNKERTKAGLSSLKMDTDITAAANVRAKEIKQSFSHTRPNGTSFSSVLKEQGVSFRGSGENIAWGQKSPEQVTNAWMNSEGHRANILNKNFKNIGIGHYQDSTGRNHWVQLFTY